MLHHTLSLSAKEQQNNLGEKTQFDNIVDLLINWDDR